MKKLLQINTYGNWGSTGRIAEQIGKSAIDSGWESYIACDRKITDSSSVIIKVGNAVSRISHGAVSRLLDAQGLGSVIATHRLVNKINEIRPDIIHLHNIHGYYINYPILFSWLKEYDAPVVWTLHDCWPLTGHCAYFDLAGCYKWQTTCCHCPQKGEYPVSYIDFSRRNFNKKRESFTSCSNLTLVPVSNWLETLVKESFLKGYRTQVIYNGIDTSVFSFRKEAYKLRDKYNIRFKYVVLGVAAPFNERKGFSDYVSLSKILPEEYGIIMVGLTSEQKARLPRNIIGIERTQDVNELAALYSLADVFLNMTYEDTFSMTNLEAMSCGLPIITYRTGGAAETIDCTTGIWVEKGNIREAKNAIFAICSKGKSEYASACRKRAVQCFNNKDRFMEYIDLYNELLTKK